MLWLTQPEPHLEVHPTPEPLLETLSLGTTDMSHSKSHVPLTGNVISGHPFEKESEAASRCRRQECVTDARGLPGIGAGTRWTLTAVPASLPCTFLPRPTAATASILPTAPASALRSLTGRLPSRGEQSTVRKGQNAYLALPDLLPITPGSVSPPRKEGHQHTHERRPGHPKPFLSTSEGVIRGLCGKNPPTNASVFHIT